MNNTKIIQIGAPTSDPEEEEVETFYEYSIMDNIIISDFNAKLRCELEEAKSALGPQ